MPAQVAASVNEWRVLYAVLWVILCCGLHYSFGTYSEDLRIRMGLNQQQLETLASGKDTGAYFGIVQGMFFDRFGPTLTILVGGSLDFVGYLGVWRYAYKPPVVLHLWEPWLFFFVATNGASWMDMGSMMCIMHNAGEERALAAGLVKSLLGLGAAVFSQVYITFLKPDAVSYLLLLAIAPFCLSLIMAPFIKKIPIEAARHGAPHAGAAPGGSSPLRVARLRALCAWVVLLAAYLFVVILLGKRMEHQQRVWATAGLLGLLLAPPIIIGRFGPRPVARHAAARITPILVPCFFPHLVPIIVVPLRVPAAEGDREGLLEAAHPIDGEGETPAAVVPAERHGRSSSPPPRLRGQRSSDLSFAQVLMCPDFWLLFFAMAVAMGASLVLINNLGQLVRALGSEEGPETLVALLSIGNSMGRLLMGFLSDMGLHRGIPRPSFFLGGVVLITLNQVALAFTGLAGLPACVVITGVCFGSFATFAPVAATELFGEKAAGTVYGLIGSAPALGSFVLNTMLAGRLYDHEARLTPPSPMELLEFAPPPSRRDEAPVCRGSRCFRSTFLLCGGAGTAAVLAAAVLLHRTQHMYAAKIARLHAAASSAASLSSTNRE